MAEALWPRGDSEMAGRIRAHDWSATPLGPTAAWPQSLKTAVDLILLSPIANILVCGPARVIIYNDPCILLYRSKHPHALGLPGPEAFPELWGEIGPLYDRVFAGESLGFEAQPWVFERGAASPKGLYDAWFTPLAGEGGEVVCAYVTAVEVTERARAQDALREHEERLALAIDIGGLGHWELGLATGTFTTSPLCRANFGRDPQAPFSYDDLVAAIHPDDRARQAEMVAAAIAAKSEFDIQYRIVTPAGELRHIEVRGRYEVNSGRDRLAGVSLDVTQAKRFEDALRESEERQAFLLKLSDALRAEPNADAIVDRAVRMLAEELRLDRCYATAMYPDEDRVDVTQEFRRPDLAPMPSPLRFSDFPEAGRRTFGRTLIFNDTANDPELTDTDKGSLAAMGFGALLSSPVRRGAGNPIWALGAVSAQPRRWTPAEVALIEEVTERTWDAIERARSEAALREREARLSAELTATQHLQEISTLLIQEDEVGAFYEHIVDAAMALMGSQAASMQLLDPASDELQLLAWRGFHPDAAAFWQTVDAGSASTCGIALNSGQRVVVPDVEISEVMAGTDDLAHYRLSGLHAVQSTPLLSRSGRLLGMISTHWREPHQPDERDLRLMDVLARQAADLIERVWAAAELRESEDRLYQFGEASSDILWSRDAQSLQWMYLTPAFEKIYGFSREEALSGDTLANWTDVILPEDRPMVLDMMEKVRAGERVSFEFRINRPSDGALRWLRDTDFPIRDANGRVVRIGGVARDVTGEKDTASRMQVLVAELQHRTRNVIAVVRSIADRTLTNSTSLEDFRLRYRDRLSALGRANGLLSRLDEVVTFDELVEAELSAHGGSAAGGQVTLEGPHGIRLPASAVQTLALAVHELTTNAVKYGAFSTPVGHLTVTWRLLDGGRDRLWVDWHETGVAMPDTSPAPKDGGYGRELIEKALPYQLEAETTYEIGADGIRCTILLPVIGGGV